MLGKKITYDYTYRLIIEDKFYKNVKNVNENLVFILLIQDQKLKLVRRIPKLSNNTSMISSIKSDLGKEMNELRDDFILKEIPC